MLLDSWRSAPASTRPIHACPLLFLALLATGSALAAAPEESYKSEIVPLLETYCFSCHGEGEAKGKFSMDDFKDLSAHLVRPQALAAGLAEHPQPGHAAVRRGPVERSARSASSSPGSKRTSSSSTPPIPTPAA